MATQTDDIRNLDTIPVGSLGIIPLESCKELGEKVDYYLVNWRTVRENEHADNPAFQGYKRDSYLLNAKVPRFGSGEAKGIILNSVRGHDLYIMVDVCNYSLTYSCYKGGEKHCGRCGTCSAQNLRTGNCCGRCCGCWPMQWKLWRDISCRLIICSFSRS